VTLSVYDLSSKWSKKFYSYHHPGLHYGGRNLEADMEFY